jgi:hypothetical protein
MAQATQLTQIMNGMQLMYQQLNAGGVAAGQQQPYQQNTPGERVRNILQHKPSPILPFDGKIASWRDWSYKLRMSMKSSYLRSQELFERAETEHFIEEDLSPEDEKFSAELFPILVGACHGEATPVCRSVEDFRGLTAWHRLTQKFNPTTMARMINVIAEVVNPPRIKAGQPVETMIQSWLEKAKILDCQFGQPLTDSFAIAIITTMLPTALQEHIVFALQKSWNKDDLLAKIRNVLGNQGQMHSGPVPMDTNAVGFD